MCSDCLGYAESDTEVAVVLLHVSAFFPITAVFGCVDDDKAYSGRRVIRTSSVRRMGYLVICLCYFGART